MMDELIKMRRAILASIETFATRNADAVHYLSLTMLYNHLEEDIENCPNPAELESILDDLALANNNFHKNRMGYFWREMHD